MSKPKISKDQAEAIVKQDIKTHYPDFTDLLISSVQLKEGFFKGSWEIRGTVSSKQFGGSRTLGYKLDADSGEIRFYEVK